MSHTHLSWLGTGTKYAGLHTRWLGQNLHYLPPKSTARNVAGEAILNTENIAKTIWWPGLCFTHHSLPKNSILALAPQALQVSIFEPHALALSRFAEDGSLFFILKCWHLCICFVTLKEYVLRIA